MLRQKINFFNRQIFRVENYKAGLQNQANQGHMHSCGGIRLRFVPYRADRPPEGEKDLNL